VCELLRLDPADRRRQDQAAWSAPAGLIRALGENFHAMNDISVAAWTSWVAADPAARGMAPASRRAHGWTTRPWSFTTRPPVTSGRAERAQLGRTVGQWPQPADTCASSSTASTTATADLR
jgi:hypothetical protein